MDADIWIFRPFFFNTGKIETIQMYISQGMEKSWHIHTMEYNVVDKIILVKMRITCTKTNGWDNVHYTDILI